jgi:hypothetical protein
MKSLEKTKFILFESYEGFKGTKLAKLSRGSPGGTFHQKFEYKHSPTLCLKKRLLVHCSFYYNFSTHVLDTQRNLLANLEIL